MDEYEKFVEFRKKIIKKHGLSRNWDEFVTLYLCSKIKS